MIKPRSEKGTINEDTGRKEIFSGYKQSSNVIQGKNFETLDKIINPLIPVIKKFDSKEDEYKIEILNHTLKRWGMHHRFWKDKHEMILDNIFDRFKKVDITITKEEKTGLLSILGNAVEHWGVYYKLWSSRKDSIGIILDQVLNDTDKDIQKVGVQFLLKVDKELKRYSLYEELINSYTERIGEEKKKRIERKKKSTWNYCIGSIVVFLCLIYRSIIDQFIFLYRVVRSILYSVGDKKDEKEKKES